MSSIPVLSSKGARKRTTAHERNGDDDVRSTATNLDLRAQIRCAEDGVDSGLSSECTTPVGGSPPPRQSKSLVTPHNVSTLIAASRARLEKTRISSSRTSRLLRSRSGTDSPKSLDSVRTRQVFSPLRTPRNVQSPSIDSGDEGSLRVDRGTYQYMFQDIVSIKTMLLKLKRVLQESGENGLTRAESLNPFDNSVKNGLFYNLNEGGTTIDASTSPGNGNVADELADLRRQVVFLQGQLEDKDRTIQSLQLQVAKYQDHNNSDSQSSVSSTHHNQVGAKETCNAATQTEKIRPVSAGPSLLQSLPQDGNMGPLVSWSDSWDHQRPPPLAELHSSKSIRKCSDHSITRASQQQRDQSYSCQDGNISPEMLSTKRAPNCRDLTKSLDAKTTKLESPSPKSAIPTPRRLAAPTLIPRAARAVSATGRSHNT